MTARPCYDPAAGEWVAYRDEPKRRFNPETKKYETVPGTTRCYLYSIERGTGMVGSSGKNMCDRLDTKAEALAAARNRWPNRVKGYRIGAERILKEA